MHPWHHARTTTRLLGGEIDAHLAVHRFIDRSKRVLADVRHRALTHHREGVAACVARFGPRIGGARTALIAEIHIREDCAGRLPAYADWLAEMAHGASATVTGGGAREGAARGGRARADTLPGAAAIFGGAPHHYAPVHRWLCSGNAPSARERLERHHAQGMFACEAALGVLCAGTEVPVRYVAEAYVRAQNAGMVPTQGDWLRRIRRAGWMGRRADIRGDEGWLDGSGGGEETGRETAARPGARRAAR